MYTNAGIRLIVMQIYKKKKYRNKKSTPDFFFNII